MGPLAAQSDHTIDKLSRCPRSGGHFHGSFLHGHVACRSSSVPVTSSLWMGINPSMRCRRWNRRPTICWNLLGPLCIRQWSPPNADAIWIGPDSLDSGWSCRGTPFRASPVGSYLKGWSTVETNFSERWSDGRCPLTALQPIKSDLTEIEGKRLAYAGKQLVHPHPLWTRTRRRRQR